MFLVHTEGIDLSTVFMGLAVFSFAKYRIQIYFGLG